MPLDEELVETHQVVVESREEGVTEDIDKLTDEECVLATPWVKGLELGTNKWGKFHGLPSFLLLD